MPHVIETIKYKGYSIELVSDEDTESPREWDNVGTMLCAHKRYNLGDKQTNNIEEIERVQSQKGTLSLPLYLYDHSGISMQTTGFSCPWDSGQVGIIYATRERILKEYGVKRITKKIKENVYGILRGEVQTYTDFLEGRVVGVITKNQEGEEIDSCFGFYPEHTILRGRHEYQYAIDEAKSAVKRDRKERAKTLQDQRANRLQTLALL